MTPRGIRNNNPGNIDKSKTAWQGEVMPGGDARFVTFSTMALGVRAMGRLLYSYKSQHNLSTIRQIISRWAPPSENNTEAYISHVAHSMGVSGDNFDIWGVHYQANLAALICAISIVENGGRYVSDADIVAGVILALK